MSVQTEGAAAPERLYALDLVRAGALLLGIIFHISIAYYPHFEVWLVVDEQRSRPIAWTGFALHSFRMATFFLIAGYFGHMMFHRRGTKAFLKDRAKRILAPLLVFWVPVLAGYGLALYYAVQMDAVPKMEAPPAGMNPDAFPLAHLWFLYVLFIYYLLLLALRSLFVLIDRSGALRAKIDALLSTLLRLPFVLPLLLVAPVAVLLLNHPVWIEWWGIPTPDRGLVPNRAAFVSYFIAFGLGWMIHRLKDGLAPLAAFWAPYLLTALALTVGALVIHQTPGYAPVLQGQERILFAVLYAGMVWFWTFGLTGAALRFITRERPAVRYMADASYWLYIIHLPPIIALQVLAARWPVPAEVKLLFVFVASMALMLASYHLLIRFTFMGKWLNGRKAPRKAKAGTEVAATA